MLNLAQRLILGCVLLGCLTVGLVVATHRALAAAGQLHLANAICVIAVVVAAATIFFVLRPIQSLARDAHRIAQGDLEHRVDWSSRDSFGVIASELNRIAVRLRELRDTEAGRRQMEFQLSDAVLQSIFEPIIVTDGKGHVLKVNQAASELLGEARGRPHGPGEYAWRRENPERHSRCRFHAEGRGCRGRGVDAADAHRPGRAKLPTAHYAHAGLRRPLAGRGDDAGRRDQPAGHGPLQNAIYYSGEPQTARSAVAVATRACMRWPRASAAR